MRRFIHLGTISLAFAILAVAVAGCSNEDVSSQPPPPSTTVVSDLASPTACKSPEASAGTGTTPIVVSQSLVVGANRLTIALQRGGKLIENASVGVRLFAPCSAVATLEGNARWLELSAAPYHPHNPSGPSEVTAPNGLYVLAVSFPAPGQWAAELSIDGAAPEVVSATLNVLAQDPGHPIGGPAPKSQTPKVGPGVNTKQIDSSSPPHPEMQQLSIADAIASGRPSLAIFATPAFCRSRICGPVFAEMVTLFPKYEDRVEFIHVEPYQLDPTGQPIIDENGEFQLAPSVAEWRFPSEPWVVVIDGSGNVAAKFEGLVTAEEVSAALDSVLES